MPRTQAFEIPYHPPKVESRHPEARAPTHWLIWVDVKDRGRLEEDVVTSGELEDEITRLQELMLEKYPHRDSVVRGEPIDTSVGVAAAFLAHTAYVLDSPHRRWVRTDNRLYLLLDPEDVVMGLTRRHGAREDIWWDVLARVVRQETGVWVVHKHDVKKEAAQAGQSTWKTVYGRVVPPLQGAAAWANKYRSHELHVAVTPQFILAHLAEVRARQQELAAEAQREKAEEQRGWDERNRMEAQSLGHALDRARELLQPHVGEC